MANAIHDEARGTMLEEPQFEGLLRRLAGYEDVEGVLSVYLDIDPAAAQREGFEAALLDTWKPLLLRFKEPALRGRLEYEIAGVTDEVQGWSQPPGRSVAMFFCGPGGLREIVALPFPVHSLARFEPRPVVGPLIAALDEHRRYGVVLFNSDEARLITVFLGAVEEETRLKSDVPAKTDVGGWGGYLQSRYARHREHHLASHARRVVEHLWASDRSRPIHSLVLAGPDEAVAVLRRALPRALDRIVAGSVGIENTASTQQILSLVQTHDEEMREREDRVLVEELIDRAASGRNAALGWDETLQALVEGRVHMLVLPGDAARPGILCMQEHFLATSGPNNCPLCGEPLTTIGDVAEAAIRTAMHTDSLVRFLAPGAATLLTSHGAAASLRY